MNNDFCYYVDNINNVQSVENEKPELKGDVYYIMLFYKLFFI